MLIKDILTHYNQVNPHKLAIHSNDQVLTYRELYLRANQVSNILIETLGLSKGNRFAIVSENNGYIPEIYFAAAQTGCVAVPINYRLTLSEICSLIQDSEAKAVFVDQNHVEHIQEIRNRTGIHTIVLLDDKIVRRSVLSYKRLIKEASLNPPNVEISNKDVVLQVYTSGTTGYPKGVMLSNRNIMSNSWIVLAEGNIRSHDRYLNVMPLCHASAGSKVFGLAFAGATHYILNKFDPASYLDVLEKEKITQVLLVPTMISKLLEFHDRNRNISEHLEMITYGAAPMPIPLLQKAMEVFQCQFWNGYGLTEATTMLTNLKPADHQLALSDARKSKLLNSVGKQALGVDLKIVDDEGKEVSAGESGEIIVKSEKVMEGYWNRPQATEETIGSGWLYTGDIGAMDEDGYLYIVDRKKDMLISGGINVYPREIEKVMEGYEGIKEVAVTGMADEVWGEVPVAFVVSESEVSLEMLQGWLSERLAKFKLPKKIIPVTELPRNSTGKIQKHLLKSQYLIKR